jgi:hypothetical protein
MNSAQGNIDVSLYLAQERYCAAPLVNRLTSSHSRSECPLRFTERMFRNSIWKLNHFPKMLERTGRDLEHNAAIWGSRCAPVYMYGSAHIRRKMRGTSKPNHKCSSRGPRDLQSKREVPSGIWNLKLFPGKLTRDGQPQRLQMRRRLESQC